MISQEELAKRICDLTVTGCLGEDPQDITPADYEEAYKDVMDQLKDSVSCLEIRNFIAMGTQQFACALHPNDYRKELSQCHSVMDDIDTYIEDEFHNIYKMDR